MTQFLDLTPQRIKLLRGAFAESAYGLADDRKAILHALDAAHRAASRPKVLFVPETAADGATRWWLGTPDVPRLWQPPRPLNGLWPACQAIRYGADHGGVVQAIAFAEPGAAYSANACRNAISRAADALEVDGFKPLASAVRSVVVARDGTIHYRDRGLVEVVTELP